jgi:hypothetical protein
LPHGRTACHPSRRNLAFPALCRADPQAARRCARFSF